MHCMEPDPALTVCQTRRRICGTRHAVGDGTCLGTVPSRSVSFRRDVAMEHISAVVHPLFKVSPTAYCVVPPILTGGADPP
jgi:hypothetical protein